MSIPNIAELIPHQGSMCLVERVLAFTDTQIWATAALDTTPFSTTRGVHTCTGIEFLAQTAAAFFTLQAEPNSVPRQGMLIGCQSYQTSATHFPLDQHLLLYAKLTSTLPAATSAANLVKFSGEIYTQQTDSAEFDSLHWRSSYKPERSLVSATLSVYL